MVSHCSYKSKKIYTGGNPSLLLRAEPDAFIDAGHGGKVGDGRGCGRAFWAIGNAAWRSWGNSLAVFVFVGCGVALQLQIEKIYVGGIPSLLLGAERRSAVDTVHAGEDAHGPQGGAGVGVGDVVCHVGRVARDGAWALGARVRGMEVKGGANRADGIWW